MFIVFISFLWKLTTTHNKIITLQKRAIRIINKKTYRYHTEPLFKQKKILMVNDLYQQQIWLFMHNFKYAKLPRSFDNYFKLTRSVTNRETRQSNLVYTDRPRTELSARLPNHSFPHIWNNLNIMNTEISNTINRNSFKNQCKSHLFRNYSERMICNNEFCRQCHM